LWATFGQRIAQDPFNLIATLIFAVAILHVFGAARFTAIAHRVHHVRDEERTKAGLPTRPSVRAELLHFLGEVEVIFGLWAVVLGIAITAYHGWGTTTEYLNHTVNYTEPLFVVVIMALAATRPVVVLAESALRRGANLGRATPWFTEVSRDGGFSPCWPICLSTPSLSVRRC
jgi:hypothetical protein